jgi:hypothetical protein
MFFIINGKIICPNVAVGVVCEVGKVSTEILLEYISRCQVAYWHIMCRQSLFNAIQENVDSL